MISKLSRSLAATESAMAKMPSTSTNSEKIESGDSMVPRGNIRPSDVLTITQVGRSSVDVTFKPRNRYVDDTGAEEEDADNVEIGDDGIGESDCNGIFRNSLFLVFELSVDMCYDVCSIRRWFRVWVRRCIDVIRWTCCLLLVISYKINNVPPLI